MSFESFPSLLAGFAWMAVAPDSRNMDNSAGMELMAATTELTGECWLPSTSGQEMDKEEEDSSQIAYY